MAETNSFNGDQAIEKKGHHIRIIKRRKPKEIAENQYMKLATEEEKTIQAAIDNWIQCVIVWQLKPTRSTEETKDAAISLLEEAAGSKEKAKELMKIAIEKHNLG